MVRWTFKYGFCGASPTAIASLAMVIKLVLGDIESAQRYAEIALSLLGKTPA